MWRMSLSEAEPSEVTGLMADTREIFYDAQSGDEAALRDHDGASGSTILTYRDDPQDMTFGRRLARYLSTMSWYYPHRDARRRFEEARESNTKDLPELQPPSLDDAWAYFEHITLPRHFLLGNGVGRDQQTKAEPGEASAETRLYSVWSTPETDLADFGIGVGAYFFTLRGLACILFVAGLLNIPSLMYYHSKQYNNDDQSGLPLILQVSAICTDTAWSACPTCSRDQWDYFPRTFERYAETEDGSLRFIKINECRFDYKLGLFNWITIVFVAIATYILCFHMIKRREIEFDEAAQTTTDYSISVDNPPTDARDPEEWKEFFSQFGHVTCCTVAVDNEELVRALVQRRTLVLTLAQRLPPGMDFDKSDLDKMAEAALPLVWWQKLMFAADANKIRQQIADLDKEIEQLSQQEFEVSEVFITFETEVAQRRAMREMAFPRIDTLLGNSSRYPDRLLFRKKLLFVREPPEPSSIRWQDLDESLPTLWSQRVATALATILLITGCMIFVTYCHYNYSPATAAFVIALVNTISPYFCYYVTELESHPFEDSKQSSRYSKNLAFRWFVTTLVTAMVTPFTDTIVKHEDSIIYSLYAIFSFELIRAPITQCLDIGGNINRHLLGPRVLNSLQMASYFQGTKYELSERYTNMTSVLFLTFYYSTIFPQGYFFAALTLVVHYWTDKFCILRIWAPAPEIGTVISSFSKSFIIATVVVLIVVSSYSVSAFPFDNACQDGVVSSEYVGNFTAKDGYGADISVSISAGDSNFYFCNQDMMRYRPPVFPAWPSNQPEGGEWMDTEQANISRVFGWTSVVVLVLCVGIFVNAIVVRGIKYMFCGLYEPEDEMANVNFSEAKGISAYVPQVRAAGFPFPLLVCDIAKIDSELLGWNDPYNGVEAHNVLRDVPSIKDRPGLFSVVRHWPPPGQK